MRKIIIDTDTGSDDAVALVMALRDPEVQVLAFTTVSGNIEVKQATYNCLQSIDYAGRYHPPVYMGAAKPLEAELETADQVHGADGMGDLGTLRVPSGKAEREHAVDAMLRIIGDGAGDIELIAIGPLTNVALAILKDLQTMKRIPRITIMGGAHPYSNPHTVWAEFNIMCDPEAADIVCSAGIPFTMITLEACWGDMRFSEKDIARFRGAGELGRFLVDCNRTAIDLAREVHGEESFDLPDPAAYAAFAKPELVKTKFESSTKIERKGKFTRGATIFTPVERRFVDAAFSKEQEEVNSLIVTELYGDQFKDYLYELIKD